MILRIDTSNSVPVYAQIVEQIKRAIATGGLAAGDPLPSLRETAIKLRVNPLTVDKAYKQLEREGLIETKHGLGSFVTESAGIMTDGFREEILERSVDNLLVDAHHLGVPLQELNSMIRRRIKTAKKKFELDTIKRKGDKDDR